MPGTFDPSTDLVTNQSMPDEAWTSALDSIAPTFSQKLIDTSTSDADPTTQSGSWVDKALSLMTAVQMSDTQRRLLNIQLDRAAKGLPPLDASQYSMGVQVGVSSGTQDLIKLALIGGGALLLVNMLSRRR